MKSSSTALLRRLCTALFSAVYAADGVHVHGAPRALYMSFSNRLMTALLRRFFKLLFHVLKLFCVAKCL